MKYDHIHTMKTSLSRKGICPLLPWKGLYLYLFIYIYIYYIYCSDDENKDLAILYTLTL